MDFDIPRVKGQPGLVGTRFKAQEVSRMFGFDPQVFPSSPHVSYHHLPLSPWRGRPGGRVEREGSCVLDQLSSRLVAERLAQGSRWKYGRGRIVVTAGSGFEATNADQRVVSEFSGAKGLGRELLGTRSCGIWSAEECSAFRGVWWVLEAWRSGWDCERPQEKCCIAGICSSRLTHSAHSAREKQTQRIRRQNVIWIDVTTWRLGDQESLWKVLRYILQRLLAEPNISLLPKAEKTPPTASVQGKHEGRTASQRIL